MGGKMEFEDYLKKKARKNREYTTNFIDKDTCLYITALFWADTIEPDQIKLIDKEDLEWLESN